MGSDSPHLTADAPFGQTLDFAEDTASQGPQLNGDRTPSHGRPGRQGWCVKKKMGTTSAIQEEKHQEGKAQNPKGENQTVRRWQPINAEDSLPGAVGAIPSPPAMTAQPAKAHQGLCGVVATLGFRLGPKPTHPLCPLAQFAKHGSPAFRISSRRDSGQG